MLDNRRDAGIALLERAVASDPTSYEVHYALGLAYRGGATYEPRSLAEMEKAAAIEPDHLDVQIDLGRQYATRGDIVRAIEHLRLALQTTDYRANDPRATEADLFLAQALQEKGYDHAALAQYERLLRRVSDFGLSRNTSPELAARLTGRLFVQVGDLYMRQGNPASALAAFEQAMHDEGDMEVRARIVHAQLALGRNPQAIAGAVNAVRHSHASPESIALLCEAFRAAGNEKGAPIELSRLHASAPGDRSILFALADVLRAADRIDEADRLLERASQRLSGDAEIVRRRFALHESESDAAVAARVLIESLARSPKIAGQVQELWLRLRNDADASGLTLERFQSLPVSNGASAARLYAVARLAQLWPRRDLAKSAMIQAARQRPVFAPALRERLQAILEDTRLTAEARTRGGDEVIQLAEDGGDPALAAELRGRALMSRNDIAGGAAALAEAIRLGGNGPELELAFAASYRAFGDNESFIHRLWKLISDYPDFAPAYIELHDFYRSAGSMAQARKVLDQWRQIEPMSLSLRLLEARDALAVGNSDLARALLLAIFEQYPDNEAGLSGLQAIYARAGKTNELIGLLESRFTRSPRAFNLGIRLAQLYGAQGHLSEASRTLDMVRQRAAAEPDVLYQLAQFYVQIQQRPTAQDVLEQVLKLQPHHAGANNDIAYFWAEEGKNLAQAEALARMAVDAEPDDASLLDSLGWVLYKRGRFQEARQVLQRALPADIIESDAAAAEVDPVVLDHLGDVMYRLRDSTAAARLWQRTAARLAEAAAPRNDLKALRLQVLHKQEQLKAGEPVSVAPIPEAPQTHPAHAEAGTRGG
jgi:tetratricopeptide (TPR) repeat protein